MGDAEDVKCWGCGWLVCGMFGIFGMWDAQDVGYSGCGIFGMLGMCDVQDVGCLGSEMFGMWDVGVVACWGCGMFGMCDVRDVECWFTKCTVRHFKGEKYTFRNSFQTQQKVSPN